MPTEKKLHNWDGERLSYDEIALRTGLSYQSAMRLVQLNIDNTEDAKILVQPKPRRTRAEILASLPKVESAKPEAKQEYSKLKAPEACTVTIRHAELDKMLNYLARVSSTTYQAAFEEFIIYLYEGRLWSKEAQTNQEAIAAIKQRLIENHNGRNASNETYEPVQKPAPLKGWQNALVPYLEELEAENAQLKAKLAQLKAFFGEIE